MHSHRGWVQKTWMFRGFGTQKGNMPHTTPPEKIRTHAKAPTHTLRHLCVETHLTQIHGGTWNKRHCQQEQLGLWVAVVVGVKTEHVLMDRAQLSAFQCNMEKRLCDWTFRLEELYSWIKQRIILHIRAELWEKMLEIRSEAKIINGLKFFIFLLSYFNYIPKTPPSFQIFLLAVMFQVSLCLWSCFFAFLPVTLTSLHLQISEAR